MDCKSEGASGFQGCAGQNCQEIWHEKGWCDPGIGHEARFGLGQEEKSSPEEGKGLMPAKSQAQRAYLNKKFGHDWVKAHRFDNKGKLPRRVKKKQKR